MARKASEAVETVVEEVKETATTKKTTAKRTTKKVEKTEEAKPAKKTTKKSSKKVEAVKTGKATIKSYDCITKPILSEETMKNMETLNKITVQVSKSSNKVEIKDAFEAIFGVKVKQVNVSNVRAKDKRVGKYSGKTSSYKKAVITLAEGQSLELLKN
jgi:large subunit ribosomal protein L23